MGFWAGGAAAGLGLLGTLLGKGGGATAVGGAPLQGADQNKTNQGPALGPPVRLESQMASPKMLPIKSDIGPETAPPDQDEQEEGRPKGKWHRTNQFLGSEAGKFGQSVVGGFINDARQRRNTRKNYDRLRRKGLTPYEIGGGGQGGVVSAQGNIMGSGGQTSTTLRTQNEFQRARDDKDRELRLKGSEPERKKTKIAQMLSDVQYEKYLQEITKIEQEIRQNKKLFEERWPRLLATMSSENVKAALALAKGGLNAQKILGALGKLNPQEKKVIDLIYGNIARWEGGPGNVGGWRALTEAYIKEVMGK